MLQVLLAVAAQAASLPGIPLQFDVDAAGVWALGAELPPEFLAAGAAPGWVLTAVDDLALTDIAAVQRVVASGPSRDVRLRFQVPAPPPTKKGAKPEPPVETILVVRRADIVRVELLGLLPWPTDFPAPAGAFTFDLDGVPVVTDSKGGAWRLDVATGGMSTTAAVGPTPAAPPSVFWALSDAPWVVDGVDELVTTPADAVASVFPGVARVRSFQGKSGDHLLRVSADGVEVLTVTWPAGVPSLPTCQPSVAESCLTSGREIMATLESRPGARDEALRHLGVACESGVYRACYEAVAINDAASAPQANLCVGGDVRACTELARSWYAREEKEPGTLVIGLLEYACAREGSGSLGERLRRLEDVGAGCMTLATAYDTLKMPDQALLNLDQACVLGRAEACDEAAKRRHLAFAARTIRECEDVKNPIAASCVELGRLLQNGPVAGATVDEFGAFLRGCSLGAADGCMALGDYVDRWGIENPRVVEAELKLRASCDAGEQRACLGAGHLLVRHDPRTEAYGEALTRFDGACEGGLAAACVAGAEQRRIGQARKIEARDQLMMWKAACDLHDGAGCAGYASRLGRNKDTWGEAYVAYGRACELGDAHSCADLGRLVAKKHDPAWEGEQPPSEYLQRSCTNGDPEGCFWLAEETLPRSGEPDEPTYLLLDQSCEGEYGDGCARLAEVHLDRKTSFDDEIAARHLDTACANGTFDSCRLLGTMYVRGKGVERDRTVANELLDRFRLNAPRTHVRLGLQAGLASGAGGEAEIVVPIPVGPALSIAGAYSYLPTIGTFMALLEGEDKPAVGPDYTYMGGTVRLYPNTQARGVYGAGGVHQITASGGTLVGERQRTGWSARLGFRGDSKSIYTGLEVGLGQYGVVDLNDFDEDEEGLIPLILPTFALSFGVAFL